VKVKQIIKLFEKDGWYLVAQKGSQQYKHLSKKDRATIPDHGQNKGLAKGTENSILKQAGLK